MTTTGGPPSGEEGDDQDSDSEDDGDLSSIEAGQSAIRDEIERRLQDFLRQRAEGRGLYSDDAGNPVLRDSFAAYVNVLGTADHLADLTNDRLRESISIYDTARRHLYSPQDRSYEFARAVYFGDVAVLALPIGPDEREPYECLLTALDSVARYQTELALHGRLVRGAITRGPLYTDDSFAWGVALNDAARLERTKARFPRIVVEDAHFGVTQSEWAKLRSLGTRGPSEIDRLLLREVPHRTQPGDAKDGVFVNYLAALLSTDAPWYADEALRVHGEVLREKLEDPQSTSAAVAKYHWAAAYHDYFVTQVTWCPQFVIGLSPMRRFASMSNTWVYRAKAASQVPMGLLDRFEFECAESDVNRISESRKAGTSEFDGDESEPLVGSINHNAVMLLEQCNGGAIPADDVDSIRILAENSTQLVTAALAAQWNLSGYGRNQLGQRLVVLDKALRVVRADHTQRRFGYGALVQAGLLVGFDFDLEVEQFCRLSQVPFE